ncbi:MAG: Ku protein, partial [Mesorhizobium sp.]
AEHIIKTKKGKFDPTKFDDRYEAALGELVKAKLEGRKIEVPKQPKREKVVDLMDALRQSAGAGGKQPSTRTAAAKSKPARAAKAKETAPRRKAG